MFTKAPFADTAGSLDGWVPPVQVDTIIFGLATNWAFRGFLPDKPAAED